MDTEPAGPTTLTDASVTVVHRARGFNWSGFVGGGPLFLIAIMQFAKNPGVHHRGIFTAGTIAAFLLLVGYALVLSLRLKQEMLTVDGDRLIYKGAWGTRTVDVSRGRAVNLAYKVGPGAKYRRWLFLNERGFVSRRGLG